MPRTTTKINGVECDDFVLAYLEAMFWAEVECDENGECGDAFQDNYEFDDLDADCLREIVAECADFRTHKLSDNGNHTVADILNRKGISDESAGHDFYFTRNRHGVGFWDRGYGAAGRILTDIAHTYGTNGLSSDGNGKLYTHG